MAVYNITFFTSEEGKDVAFTLESKKLTTKDFSSFEFIRVLKLFIGGKDKIVENKTYILQIAANWKDLLITHLTRWSETFRELNNVIALISQLDEGRCLGISFNDNLDIQKSKELYFLMQEVEQGIPAKPRYEEFLRQYSDFFNVYRPLSYLMKRELDLETLNGNPEFVGIVDDQYLRQRSIIIRILFQTVLATSITSQMTNVINVTQNSVQQ